MNYLATIRALKLRIVLTVLSSLTFLFSMEAQEPNHKFLGDDFFSGVKIFDLIQDQSLDYWIVTSHGLFHYDGYEFMHVENEEIKSSALFNLRMNRRGDIFFNDLSGSVYRIKDQIVELYLESDHNQNNHNVYLDISDKDELLIQAEHLTVANDGAFKTYRYDTPYDKARISFTTLHDGSVVCMTGRHSIRLKGDSLIETMTPPLADGTVPRPTAWVHVEGKEFAIDQSTMQLLEYDLESNAFSFVKTLNQELMGNALRVYNVDDQIWLIGSRNGAYIYDRAWNPLNNGKPLFEHVFISDVFTDHEGNALLSTFDEGIMVVPNLHLRSFSVSQGSKISDIAYYRDGSVLVGTDQGALVIQNGNGEKEVFTSDNGEAVDFVAYSKEHDRVVFATPTGFAIGRFEGDKLNVLSEYPGAIKSASFDQHACFIALNYGVVQIDLQSLELVKCTGLIRRAYDVEVDKNAGTAFAVMIDGLFTKHGENEAKPVLIDGKRVRATQVERGGDYVYVGTEDGAMLIFKDDALVEEIELGAAIQRLVVVGNELFVKTLDRTALYSTYNSGLQESNKYYGIDLKNVIDAAQFEGELLFVEDRRYSRIDERFIQDSLPPLNVELSGIMYGGNPTNDSMFPYSKENFEFHFGVSTLRYRDFVHYDYKLNGWDDEWKSLDYTRNSVEFLSLPPGKYEFVVRAVNGVEAGNEASIAFEVDAPYFQKPWFYAAILVVLFLLFLRFSAYRVGQIRKKNEEEMEKQRMTTDLLEMELRALRSQMNPHFIFNALNSIQNLVLKEDIDNSYDYLVLFAKLVRSTLNYSNLNFIPIEQEIEFLEVYLSLEELRLKEGFHYSITFNGQKDFNVPPLIIQPFIENALVHGLLHKAGEKRLTIEFEVGEHLTCVITDNGVGRAKAKEVDRRTMLSEHKSFAMKAIQQRLDLLNKHLGKEVGGYEVIDLEEQGKPIGTKVIIKLPIEWKY